MIIRMSRLGLWTASPCGMAGRPPDQKQPNRVPSIALPLVGPMKNFADHSLAYPDCRFECTEFYVN